MSKKTVEPIISIVSKSNPHEGKVRVIFASKHPHIVGGGALNSKMYEVVEEGLDNNIESAKTKYKKLVNQRYKKMEVA